MSSNEPPEEIAEMVCESIYRHIGGDPLPESIDLHELRRFDAINFRAQGFVTVDGREFTFDFDDGNIAGTVWNAWGPADVTGLREIPEPERMVLAPLRRVSDDNPLAWKIFAAWQKEPWFSKLEGEYNYDRFFSPTDQIYAVYREKAAARGMEWVCASELRRRASDPGVAL